MKSKSGKIHVSIVIPVFNSEKTIGVIVDELIKELTGAYGLEIVLVNDASQDNSEKACLACYRKHRDFVRFFSLKSNVGEHNAVMAGLGKVTGDYIVIMDDDGQNPVKEVKRLIEKAIGSGSDVVYTHSDKPGRNLFRRSGSMFANLIAGLAINKPKGLYLSSFKCVNRVTVKNIVNYTFPFPYIDGLLLRATDNIDKLRVEEHKRKTGRSGYSFRKLLALWLNMFFGFSIVPFLVFLFLSVLVSVILFSVMGRFLIPLLEASNHGFAWLWIILILLVVAGHHFILFWFLGEYLVRRRMMKTNVPQYIIKKSYESTETKNE